MKITSNVQKPASCCDVDSHRYALGNVKIKPNCEGVWLVSTNSRALAVSHADIEGELCEGHTMLPAKSFGKNKSAKPKTTETHFGESAIWTNSEGKTGELPANDAECGRFPDVSSVLPEIDTENGFTVTLDAEILANLAAAIMRKDDKKLTFHLDPKSFGEKCGEYQEGIAVTVSSESDDNDNIGVIMPLVSNDERGTRRETDARRLEAIARDWNK